MPKLIAHRGNINGPNIKEENKPEYLIKTINKGFFVELDLWYLDDKLYLGHDNPEYMIDYSFLFKNKDKMFIHCKNIEALDYCLKKNDNLEFFFHESDEYVLTSKGNIWTFPGKKLTNKSICVMPERINNNYNLSICAGICSDYVLKYKLILGKIINNFKSICDGIHIDNVLKYKPKVAILLSGHIRNLSEIINNFKENLIRPLEKDYDYDINIHTWDINIIEKDTDNNNQYYNNINITKEFIYNLFKKNDLNINKIIIENQKEIENKLNVKTYLEEQLKGRSFHNSYDSEYISNRTNSLFFQYYGHSKVLDTLDLDCEYDFIIKTRTDMFYEKFDINLFKHEIFFPNSHLFGGCNINQLFFGGKKEYMINILKYFETIIFNNNNINFEIVKKYHKYDINFNCLFRFYIFNHLKYTPFFTNYNPKIYRNKENIITIN